MFSLEMGIRRMFDRVLLQPGCVRSHNSLPTSCIKRRQERTLQSKGSNIASSWFEDPSLKYPAVPAPAAAAPAVALSPALLY